MRSRGLLLVLALAGVGGCRSLTPLELDHLVQGAVEARLADGVRDHHARLSRPWPAVFLAVDLEDPQGIADANLRAVFFESMRQFLASPRLHGTTAPEPTQTLAMARQNLGSSGSAAWDELAAAPTRSRIRAEFERLGAAVDYFVRGQLARAGRGYRLDLEVRDATTWERIGPGGS